MSDRGVIRCSSKSGQFVSSSQLAWIDCARPPTSEGRISFVRTLIWVFLDSVERPLSQEYIKMPEGYIICHTKVLDRARPSQVSSSVQVSSFGLTTRAL